MSRQRALFVIASIFTALMMFQNCSPSANRVGAMNGSSSDVVSQNSH